MSIKRFVSIKDNTITDAFKDDLRSRGKESNMGASDILEVYSIYGQASNNSTEKSRILLQFPINEIRKKRLTGEIPESGSVSFKVKLFNAEHGSTVPTSYRMSAYPILERWDEGLGLDMEGFTDSGSCNWTYSSGDLKWINEGATYLNPDYYGDTYNIEREFGQDFDSGLENFNVDVTGLVEEWIKGDSGTLVHATGTIGFTENPAVGSTLTFHAANGDHRIFRITTTGSSNDVNYDKSISVARGVDIPTTVTNLISSIDASSLFIATAHESDTSKYKVIQADTGIFGNTKIFTNLESGVNIEHFTNGQGAINNGILVKLSGSAESGDNLRSYYTKRFFARGSEFFLKRPVIEAQWDDSVQDDRNCSYRSTALASTSDNKNNVYLYNKIRGQLRDIPGITDNLIVRFVTSEGTTDPDVALQGTSNVDFKTLFSKIYVTASRVSTGVYKATFEYSGTGSITDIWLKDNGAGDTAAARFTHLVTGSTIQILENTWNNSNKQDEYIINCINLKESYSTKEKARFRFHTRASNWNPNSYTKLTKTVPTEPLKESYYTIKRVTDNFVVIPYSTASSPEFSRLSYDISGSYMDLDISILEPNYLYEINILRKNNSTFIEQEEKFRFRVD